MKLKSTLFILTGSLVLSCGENATPEATSQETKDTLAEVDPNAYDSVYAAKLGADNYGMKTYVMAFLKDGPNNDLDSAEAAELQIAHMENINRMAEEGKLVVAGPFYSKEGSDLRGIYVFNVPTIEEAEALTNSDPAVQAGTLVMDLQMWYCSAALMEINSIHKRIAKENP